MRDTVITLFDDSANLFDDWIAAGYRVLCVDVLNPVAGGYAPGGAERVYGDLTQPFVCPVPLDHIAFVNAHPPCDHLAVSGARWFKGKGLRKLADSVSMFATAAEFCEASGAPYMIENPVSTISTYWRKPDYTYHPWEYTGYSPAPMDDNYTKKTCLWVGGGFVMPPKSADKTLPPPDDRIHKAGGKDQAYVRSVTPKSFGKAVFLYNAVSHNLV